MGRYVTFLSGVGMLAVQGHPDFSLTYNVYIYTGALMGTLMFLNVWLIIWPAQQVVIASSQSVAGGGEADPEAGNSLAKAGLASRTNTLFSIPMLFFMGAARGLGADSTSQTALIVSTVIILLIQANAMKGKMGPMASVKGVIHCGLVLTVILYCSHCVL